MFSDYNSERPLVLHIDLNSCFATIEQQSRPLLRGKPVAIVNRRTDKTAIVTASYEAKKYGVKVGMKFKEAARLCPGLIMLESDPPKYRFVYHKLMDIMNDYSAHVRMKSIDEGVIDFHESTEAMRARDLRDIGMEIKQRLYDEVGEAMQCNVGIGTNRFLAKMAASLNKPNGLDIITHDNLRETYGKLQLMDLTGIATQNKKRLNAVGIYTPLEFLDAPAEVLHKMVFKSICGDEWYRRLRGWEVDKRDSPLKTVGRQFVLDRFDLTREEIVQRLHHLAEEVGAKLRSQNMLARGVFVYAKTYDRRYWHARRMATMPFFSNRAIFEQVDQLFEQAPDGIREIGVSCYELSEDEDHQMSLFGDALAREKRLTYSVDLINRQFGPRVIHTADTLVTNQSMHAKIPFGSTRYL